MMRPLTGPCIGLSVGVGVAAYLLVQILSFRLNGAFEYPLDDVYIHLAAAEQIAAGGYGVNPGEVASAVSSPIFPLFLVPFAQSALQPLLPLFWNALALVLGAWIWGRIIADAVPQLFWAVGLAIAGPLAFNMPGISFAGMEHMLHMLAGLAVLRGLQVLLAQNPESAGTDAPVSWLLITGALLGPLLRFEGLAVTGGAALCLILIGRWKLGLSLFGLGVAGLLLFMGFLVAIGLDPLPNSVMAKQYGYQTATFSLSGQIERLSRIMARWHEAIFLALAVVLCIAAWGWAVLRGVESRVRALLLGAAFCGIGHLLVGRFGWFHRYEPYAICFVFGAIVIAFFRRPEFALFRWALVPLLFFLASNYSRHLLEEGPWATAGIYSQQRNMAFFAKDLYGEPVAVNDLGHVSWRNPNHVLDLWGLASERALKARMAGAEPGWAGAIVADSDAHLVMIYDDWFKDGLGADWIKLGELVYTGQKETLGGRQVSFYATDAEAAVEIRPLFQQFSERVSGHAEFIHAEDRGDEK